MTVLQELLLPQLDDLVRAVQGLNARLDRLLAALERGAPQQVLPAAAAPAVLPVLPLPTSPAGLVQALIAAGWGGFVTGAGLRIVKAVAPGGQAVIQLVPRPGEVAVAFQPIRFYSNLHSPDLTLALVVDGRLHGADFALTADVEAPFVEFAVVKREFVLTVTNGTPYTATVTLEIFVAGLKLSVYEKVVRPMQDLVFEHVRAFVESATGRAGV